MQEIIQAEQDTHSESVTKSCHKCAKQKCIQDHDHPSDQEDANFSDTEVSDSDQDSNDDSHSRLEEQAGQ